MSTTYNAIIDKAAESARWTFSPRNPEYLAYSRAYVWYKPGEVVVAHKQPVGFELAFAEPMTGMIPYSHMRTWLWDHCRSVPCLPAETIAA